MISRGMTILPWDMQCPTLALFTRRVVMKTHYRELVTKAEAESWFAATPEKPVGNMIQFSPQQAVG
jgi:hypothetical protein